MAGLPLRDLRARRGLLAGGSVVGEVGVLVAVGRGDVGDVITSGDFVYFGEGSLAGRLGETVVHSI